MPENVTDIENLPFMLGENALMLDAEVVAQIEAHDGPVAYGTIMAYEPTNENWLPWTDETATDGLQYPVGVLLRAITEAAIQAGDVEDVPILIGNQILPADRVVFENSLTADTIINVPVNLNTPAWGILAARGIFLEDMIQTSVPVPD